LCIHFDGKFKDGKLRDEKKLGGIEKCKKLQR